MCASVRYEVSARPRYAGYCHCTRCQRRTGTGSSAQARVVPGSATVTAGAELVRAYEPTDGAAKEFCSACGSALWSREAGGDIGGIRMAAFDSDPGVRPSYRQYVAYAAEWEPIPEDGLPRYDERRPAGT